MTAVSKTLFFILIALFCVTSPAGAMSPGPGEIPSALIREALDHNPGIKAAKLKWRAAVEDIRLAASLADPQVKYTDFTDPIETRLGPQEWSLTVNQKIPFPAKLAKRSDIAAARAELARLNFEVAVRETIRNLRRSFASLAYLNRAESLARDNLSLIKKAALLAAEPEKSKNTLNLDLLRAASQEAQAGYDLILIQEKTASETEEFNALLARKPEQIPGRIELAEARPLSLDLEDIQAAALAHHEEIRAAEIRSKIAANKKTLARLSFLPDFSIGMFYAEIGRPEVASPPPEAGRNAMGISGGLTLPLWLGKNTSRLAQARADEEASLAAKHNLENQTRVRVSRTYFKLKNSLRLVSLYRDNLIPQATAQLGVSESEARNDLRTLANHLEALATLYNFRLSLARARSDYQQELADLEALAGRPLTSRNGENGP